MTDFSIDRGTDATIDLALKDSAGAAVDLTGAQIWFTAKKRLSHADVDAVIQKTVAGGGIVVDDAPGGLAHVVILPADTVDLPFYRQTLHYDVKTKVGTNYEIVAKGTITVEPVVTESV